MQIFQTAAILGRTVDYGEADRICTLLTRERGKISALARNAKKSRKRYGGALSLFVIGSATLQPPTRGEMFRLEQFRCDTDLGPRISPDIIKVAHGSYVIELARELWPTDQPDPQSYDLLQETLQILADHPPSPPLLRSFELKILGAAGMSPSLDLCVGCGRPVEGAMVTFNINRGGLICPNCGSEGIQLAGAAHLALKALQREPLPDSLKCEMSPRNARSIRDLMVLLLQSLLQKELRSLSFISQLSNSS